ncbi:MAG TPA: biotin/lipoyl-containing protein [Anaerolineales bacterium]|nr:biotin/lipoyl-containing protein [Anaerolineales bacterium]
MKYLATIGDHTFEIEVRSDREIILDGKPYAVDFLSLAGQPVYSLIHEAQSYEAYVHLTDEGLQVLVRGQSFQVDVEDERQRRLRQTSEIQVATKGELHLKAPMPGLIVAVPVSEGQAITKGTNIVILESMKMQNELKSTRDGVVQRVRVRPGDRVEQNQVLVTLA